MSEKRYYWLKLKEGFFSQKEIKKLRSIAGGDTYTIIYLKMQLKSLAENGSLFYEGFEDDFATELALEIDENAENVKVTLLYLEKHGLIEKIINEHLEEFHLPAVKESTGTETSSAVRVRRHRNKKMLQSNIVVTPMKQIVNGELELELELDKDIKQEIERKEKKSLPKKDSANNNALKSFTYTDMIKEIIEYLNVKCNKRYTLNNSSYNKHIIARIKEGYNINDFKKVIDNKLHDTFFKSNTQYYNPITLFRISNFEKYLNEDINNTAAPPEATAAEIAEFDKVFKDVACR